MHETMAIILAAGQGKRMRSNLPKPLVALQGRPIIRHLLDATEAAGVEKISVVVGHQSEQMCEYLGAGYATPLQSVRLGTAHAVQIAQESVRGARDVFVFVGDSPLIRTESIARLHEEHRRSGAACSFLTADFAQHFPYARVVRGEGGRVCEVVEERDCTPEQYALTEYLTSHFVFDSEKLWAALAEVQPHPKTQERYLTDVIGILMAQGELISAVAIEDWRELVGLNTPEEVQWAEEVLTNG